MSKELNFDPSISRSGSIFNNRRWGQHFNHCHISDGLARIWRGDYLNQWFWSIELYNVTGDYVHGADYVQGKAASADDAMDMLEKWYKIMKADMKK